MSDDDLASVAISRPLRAKNAGPAPKDAAIVKTVMDSLTSVITSKSDQIRRAMDQKGGWEGWLQVELADHLLTQEKKTFLQYFTERETHVFSQFPRKKVDLWFKPLHTLTTGWPYVGVELKTHSIGQKDDGKPLASRFMTDVKKCASGADMSKLTTPKVLFLCVGVTSEQSDLKNLLSAKKEKKLKTYSFKAAEGKEVLKEGNNRDMRPVSVVWTWTVQTNLANGGDEDGMPGVAELETQEQNTALGAASGDDDNIEDDNDGNDDAVNDDEDNENEDDGDDGDVAMADRPRSNPAEKKAAVSKKKTREKQAQAARQVVALRPNQKTTTKSKK